MGEQHAFRDQRGLAKMCVVLLLLQSAVALFGVISAWWTYDLLSLASTGRSIGPEVLEADATRGMIVALLSIFLYAIGAVAVLTWIYSASRHAHLAGVLEMTVTPGWAVGWYFVPFANLFMPFRAMREIEEASAAAVSQKERGSAGESLMLGWWGSWLAMNITTWVSFRIAGNASSVDDLRTAAMFDMISCVLMVSACLLLSALIGRIQSFQNRAALTD
jgi:uncharacterized membrane protein